MAVQAMYGIPLVILNKDAREEKYWWNKINHHDEGPFLGLYLAHQHYELVVA